MSAKHLCMRVIGAVMVAAGLSVAVGCADTGVVGGKYDEARAYPSITLSQPSLQDALGFQEATVTRTANNLLKVTQPVRAQSNDQLSIEYRAVWFDQSGQPIPPESSWKSVRLEPRQPAYITVMSSSPDAVRYNLQFRWARP